MCGLKKKKKQSFFITGMSFDDKQSAACFVKIIFESATYIFLKMQIDACEVFHLKSISFERNMLCFAFASP